MALLAVEDLGVAFGTRDAPLVAVSGVSFSVDPGEVLGVVGESGSGKSVTALSVIGLVPEPGRITSGRIVFEGEDLIRAGEARLRAVRGDRIAMIFQDPLSSLNPYLTIGELLAEVLQVHRGTGRKEAWRRAAEMLERVGIARPGERVRAYPHQLSGGMRQRVMIGMALLCDPALILADEPTSALDVTVQAQILELFRQRREEAGTSFVLVTHDLGVLAGLADRAVVMYAGRVMEEAPAASLFAAPRHPYTQGLARAIPTRHSKGARLVAIPGAPPALGRVPPGCAFHPRCPEAIACCRTERPELEERTSGHRSACHLAVPPGGSAG